jgi:hypothetical protein
MRLFDLLPSLLRRFPALLLVGMFALMATGLVHGDCTDGNGEPEQTECVVICKCACHHHVYVSNPDPAHIDFDLSESKDSLEHQNFLPDAEPTGIFRPPKHLV